MHIAYFSPSWPPAGAANGIVTYVQQVREELLRLGHDVTIVSQGHAFAGDDTATPLDWLQPLAERLIAGGARLMGRRMRRLPQGGVVLARAFAQAHARHPIDVIEMEESFGWSSEVQSRIAVPVVTRLHGPYFLTQSSMFDQDDEALGRRRAEAEGRSIRRAKALSAPSQALMDIVVDRYGSDARWKAVIPNPVTPASPDELWSLAGCDPHAFLLVGRFDSAKGADVALKAMEIVLAEEPSATLTLVGPDKGIELENGRIAGFEEYCTAKVPPSVRDAVRFLGPINRAAIDPLRRQSLATLVCSRFENFPYAVLEAMALGGPLITSDSCQAEHLVSDGETGWIVPTGSAEALAERMLAMIAAPDRAAEMAMAGWKRCRQHYSTEVIVPQLLEFYGTVRSGFAAP